MILFLMVIIITGVISVIAIEVNKYKAGKTDEEYIDEVSDRIEEIDYKALWVFLIVVVFILVSCIFVEKQIEKVLETYPTYTTLKATEYEKEIFLMDSGQYYEENEDNYYIVLKREVYDDYILKRIPKSKTEIILGKGPMLVERDEIVFAKFKEGSLRFLAEFVYPVQKSRTAYHIIIPE